MLPRDVQSLASDCAQEGYPLAGDPASWRATSAGRRADHDDDDVVPSDPAAIVRARSIAVVPQNDAGCESEVLGLVDVHEGAQTEEQALDILRRKVAVLGAEILVSESGL